MSDPKTAPAEAPEALSEAGKSAEALLVKFRAKMETAVSDEEKRRYSALVQKLETSLAHRSEQARSATHDALSDFMSNLSKEDRTLVEKVKSDTGAATEKARDSVAGIARKVETAVPETGDLARAAKEGDKDKALEAGKKIVDKAAQEGGQIIEKGGEKLRVYAGSAAVNKLLEPLKNADDVGSFLEAVLEFFKNFFKFVFSGGTISEVIDDGKKAVGDAKDALKNGKDAISDAADKAADEFRNPEKRKEAVDKIVKTLSGDISKKYFSGADLSPAKLARLRAIVDDSFDNSGLAKIAKSYVDNGETTVGEIISAIGNAANLPKFAFSLAMSGILPVGKIAYDATIDTGKAVFSLSLDGMGLPPVFMEQKDLEAFFATHAKAGAFKDYALDMARIELYRPMGLFYSLVAASLGAIAKSGVAVFADTATGANGFTIARGIATSDFDKVFGEFSKIEKVVGASSASGEKASAVLADLKKELLNVNRNWALLGAAREVGYDVDKILAHPKIAQAMKDGIVTQADVARLKAAKGMQNPLQSVISAPDTRGFNVSQEFKMGVGTSEGVLQRFLRELDDVKAFQNTLARKDGGSLEKLNRLGEWIKTMKVARAADTVVLHLETPDDVAKLKAVQSVWPEGLSGFFKALPVLGFTGSVFSVVVGSKAEGEVKGKDIGNALAMALVPIYGSVHIISGMTVSWEDIKNGKLPSLTDAALGSLAVTTLAIEGSRLASHTVEAAKLLANGRVLSAGKTIGQGVAMHAIDLVKSAAYVARGVNHVRMAAAPMLGAMTKLMANGAETAMATKNRIAIIAAGLLIAGGAAAAMLEKKTPQECEDALKKDGWLDDSGNPTSAFFNTFHSLDLDRKREILDTLFAGKVDLKGKSPKVSYDENAREYAVVVKKSEERDTWQDILNRDPQFRDQLARLSIDVRVLSEEEVKASQSAAKTEKK